jgi:hypothetical protein
VTRIAEVRNELREHDNFVDDDFDDDDDDDYYVDDASFRCAIENIHTSSILAHYIPPSMSLIRALAIHFIHVCAKHNT